MTQDTQARRVTGLREIFQPPRARPGPPWWRPVWSVPAAMRAVRATLVVPGMLALTFTVIGDPQMAVFAVFGSFGALVMVSFGGSRRDKAVAHLGLAAAGSIGLIIGTLVSGSALLAALVTLPVAFLIYFSGVTGPSAAGGVTAALLAYVLPVASAGGVATIGSRLEGWWLAQVVSTAAVLLLSPRSPGDRLRQSAGALARALAHHLQAAVDGTTTPGDREASLAAKHELMTRFGETPFRPIGLAVPDQALASLIALLEWCSALACETTDGHLDLGNAAGPDRDLLAESAAALRAVAELLDGRDAWPRLDRVWHARSVSAAHLRGLTGDPEDVRRRADYAFHAQAVGIAASAAGADALVATRRLAPEAVERQRRRWLESHASAPGQAATAGGARDGAAGGAGSAGGARDGPADGGGPAGGADPAGADLPHNRRPPLLPVTGTIAADTSVRSVWFRNSARGAAALAAAVAVAKLTDVQHAFWVVLGTLSVLRSSAGATGSTALRALVGTVLGFVIGAGLIVGIGVSPAALWTALPLAVLVAAYAPGTTPFAVGQAAFTVTVVVLFNLLVPAGWQVGLVRVEDVAIGCAVSVVVGVLFWPHGASSLVGDNLADALRAGAAHLVEATEIALGLPRRQPGHGPAAVAAGIRLDDALRGYLTEQGSKRMAKQDLWALAMSALRLRLTAHSLASLPGPEAGRGPAARHPIGQAVTATLMRESAALAGFYDAVAVQVSRPGPGGQMPPPVPLPAGVSDLSDDPCTEGPAHYHPEALWVRDHLIHLGGHSAQLIGPAGRLAALRRRPWWR
jgi:uncharacterized membrane protein YccC